MLATNPRLLTSIGLSYYFSQQQTVDLSIALCLNAINQVTQLLWTFKASEQKSVAYTTSTYRFFFGLVITLIGPLTNV